MCTQNWLKYYVMLRFVDRTVPKEKLQLAPILKTFTVSALFHGYYHGYYSFFVGLFLADIAWKVISGTALAAYCQRVLPARLCNIICIGATQLELRYFSTPFFMLTWKNCLNYYRAFYWSGHILPITLIFVGLLLPKVKKQPRLPGVPANATVASDSQQAEGT